MKILIFSQIFWFFFSCAGPTNPFGGQILIGQEFEVDHSFKQPGVNISATPDRQYYNSPFNLKLKIYDPDFRKRDFRYEIVYNNQILNRWFKTEEIVFPVHDGDPVEISFKNLSILPGNINKIKFLYYTGENNNPVTYQFKVPDCVQDKQPESIHITPFKVSKTLEENISMLARKYEINPSLIAALIAQESSFNPNALSFAYALGLTQVTPTAAKEIKRFKKNWQIYPNFTKLPLSNIKRGIASYKINSINDWRLDPKKSIEGGIVYLQYLENYWASPDKKEILNHVFNQEVPMTDILLASYNSGAFRVKNSILEHKKNWLFDDELNEARKYVMNIKSYCHSFNTKKGSDIHEN